MLKENNIIDCICNNCNLKIKNTKELIVLFHNSKGFDNADMIDIFFNMSIFLKYSNKLFSRKSRTI